MKFKVISALVEMLMNSRVSSRRTKVSSCFSARVLGRRIGKDVIDYPVYRFDAKEDVFDIFLFLHSELAGKQHGEKKFHASERVLYLMRYPGRHFTHGQEPFIPFISLFHLLDFGDIFDRNDFFAFKTIAKLLLFPPVMANSAFYFSGFGLPSLRFPMMPSGISSSAFLFAKSIDLSSTTTTPTGSELSIV